MSLAFFLFKMQFWQPPFFVLCHLPLKQVCWEDHKGSRKGKGRWRRGYHCKSKKGPKSPT